MPNMKSLFLIVQKLWPRFFFATDRHTDRTKLDAPEFHSRGIKTVFDLKQYNICCEWIKSQSVAAYLTAFQYLEATKKTTSVTAFI